MALAAQLSIQPRLRFKKIAVLTDFSDNAAVALQCAAKFARKYRSSIILAHAYLPLPCAYSAPEPALVLETLNAERQNLKNQLFAEFRKNERELEGIECSVFLTEGVPGDMLRKLPAADLIVIGTSGQTGVRKLALGSSAETVFRCAEIPVLTVGPHYRGTPETAIGTVLYATDFSASAEAAFPYALSIAEENRSKLVLLHVASDQDAPFSFDQAMATAAPLQALQRLAPDKANLKSSPSCVVAFGRPEEVILEKAQDQGAGLIVLGARSVKAFASVISHWGGGTAYRVAANAKCPVLTVRRKR